MTDHRRYNQSCTVQKEGLFSLAYLVSTADQTVKKLVHFYRSRLIGEEGERGRGGEGEREKREMRGRVEKGGRGRGEGGKGEERAGEGGFSI